jgi:uncharacterized protein YjlB
MLVTIHRGVIDLEQRGCGGRVRMPVLGKRGATDWRDGIYHYHHDHSLPHGALGIAAGTPRSCSAVPAAAVKVAAGDAIVLPVRIVPRRISANGDVLVVCAYPAGQAGFAAGLRRNRLVRG